MESLRYLQFTFSLFLFTTSYLNPVDSRDHNFETETDNNILNDVLSYLRLLEDGTYYLETKPIISEQTDRDLWLLTDSDDADVQKGFVSLPSHANDGSRPIDDSLQQNAAMSDEMDGNNVGSNVAEQSDIYSEYRTNGVKLIGVGKDADFDNTEMEFRRQEEELKSLLSDYQNTALIQRTAEQDIGISKSNTVQGNDEVAMEVGLPGVSVTKDDTYLCTAIRIDDFLQDSGKPIYIKKYVPHAKQTVAHHMLLYGCVRPGLTRPGAVWDCAGLMRRGRSKYLTGEICGSGRSTILWAWAKDAPPFSLPKDIGFKVGDTTNVHYLVLQVHYKSASVFKGGKKDYSSVTVVASKHRMPRLAGVYVLVTSMGSVPPHQTTNFDIYCRYNAHFAIYPFAFRTHTHALGKKVMGYRIRDGIWTLIGEKNPQLPQEFYPVANNMSLHNGDMLAARCVMHNFRNVRTNIGYRHTDEMCNFYIMFWTDSRNEGQLDHWQNSCGHGFPWIHWSSLPGYPPK